MKTVVVYKSKTGFTKTYAEWIAEKLGANLFESSTIKNDEMIQYDTIIYGGGLYAGGINGSKRIIKNYKQFENKNVIIFATGATPTRTETTLELIERNIPEELQEQISFFYLRGGFNFNKLGWLDKLLMRMMRRMLKNKKEKTPDEKGMLAAFDNPVDFCKQDKILSIVERVEALA